jgi:hypothetical protein
MSDQTPLDLDALIRAQVDRAVAPYLGKQPAFMIDKLRELSERYWRENPVAVESLRRKLQKATLQSATTAIDPQADEKQGEPGKEEV